MDKKVYKSECPESFIKMLIKNNVKKKLPINPIIISQILDRI